MIPTSSCTGDEIVRVVTLAQGDSGKKSDSPPGKKKKTAGKTAAKIPLISAAAAKVQKKVAVARKPAVNAAAGKAGKVGNPPRE